MKKTIIDTYRNLPGEHCGSSAMRNLLYHYCGLDMSEAAVFGLGSGIDAMYITDDHIDPAASIFGRSITMEADATQALGVDYREQPEADDEKAWQDVREEVAAGRPTMLTGDVFFLDYRKFKYRFPAHRFVLVGFDDEKQVACLADRIDVEPQPCSYGALAESRNPKTGISTFNLWGKFFDPSVTHTMEDAVMTALLKTGNRMTGKDLSQAELLTSVTGGRTSVVTGIDGLRAFAEDLVRWHEREDAGLLATYASQCIEKFGSGGGNFRRLYTGFLDWACTIVPDRIDRHHVDLSNASADHWTRLAGLLDTASKQPEVNDAWTACADRVAQIIDIESELFTAFAD